MDNPLLLRSWMKANRHSSYTFAALLGEKHQVAVSPKTVQAWMAGTRPISERYREAVQKSTKLKLGKKSSKPARDAASR